MSGNTLNYDKWDHIDDSDDELNQTSQPVLESTKSLAQREADAAVAARFTGYMRRHLKKEYSLAERQLAAQFIGAQHRGEAFSNIYRYNDICSFMARYADELSDRSTTSMLCELHQRLLKDVPAAEIKDEENLVVKDSQTLLEAINALEACATHRNAVIFFEEICTPSSSGRARALAERYERKAFAKRAMMKHLFKEDPAFGDVFLDEGDAPAGSSARRGKQQAAVWWQDHDLRWLIGMVVGSIGILLCVGANTFFILRAPKS